MRFFHNVNKEKIDRYANLFLGCTSDAAKFLSPDHVINDKNYIVINNAIELEKYVISKQDRSEIRKELNINDDAFVIGNVEHLIDIKNQPYLIDIFYEINKKIENSFLVLVGTGVMEEEIKNKSKNLGLEDKIIFTGRRNDINKIMNALDVFVMTSKFEGLPLVAVEAQASGLMCFFSTNISENSKLTDLAYFIKLSSGPKKWADFIIEKSLEYNRINKFEELTEKRFNTKENVKYVRKLLLN